MVGYLVERLVVEWVDWMVKVKVGSKEWQSVEKWDMTMVVWKAEKSDLNLVEKKDAELVVHLVSKKAGMKALSMVETLEWNLVVNWVVWMAEMKE
jgi:hypothetical protein